MNPSFLLKSNKFMKSSITDKFQTNPFVKPIKRELSQNSIFDPVAPMDTSNLESSLASPIKNKITQVVEEEPEIGAEDDFDIPNFEATGRSESTHINVNFNQYPLKPSQNYQISSLE